MPPGARTLDQIYASLGSTYDPQANLVRQRQAELPGQLQNDESALQGQQNRSFDKILGGARARGVGFSGIPLHEQARYTADVYMPELAKLRGTYRSNATSLEASLNEINERRSANAQNIYTDERDYYESLRRHNLEQAEAARARAAAGSGGYDGAMPSFGGGGGGASGGSATATQRPDKGFNYTDANGRPISAAQYAAAKGIPFRKVLQAAASKGDVGAKTALGFVGDDYGYDPRKMTSQSLANLYNALVWGTGKSATWNGGRIAQPVPGKSNTTITYPGYRPDGGHPNIRVG